MLEKQLIINADISETRVALLEREHVAEVFIERHSDRAMLGNIYKGVVSRVLPGMQSAFINIGTSRSAFLYGGDVVPADLTKVTGEEIGADDVPADSDDDLAPEDIEKKIRAHAQPIERVIREGQTVFVQVAKEPLGTKGARVSMYLSLPGRYLVLMPGVAHIGVSRRIEDEAERKRLKAAIREVKPKGIGVIVRTAGKDADKAQLQKDLKHLLKVWKSITAKAERMDAPASIYQDLSLIQKTTRDMYSDDIVKIVIDDKTAYEDLKKFLQTNIPGASNKLELYEGKTPIFDLYGIEMDISRALGSKIELPSGGYLVIDQTEALTSFDINTGKFVGSHNQNETILRTNLEAVKKVVAQLRIRNIGGIIVIDFIDMERAEDREKVYNALQEELKQDKARSNVLKISELGLVQMTRKRTSDSLERQLLEPCPYCNGRGRIRSTPTEAYDLIREVVRTHIQTGQVEIKVKAREDIRDWILEEERQLLDNIAKLYQISVQFLPTDLSLASFNEAAFEVVS